MHAVINICPAWCDRDGHSWEGPMPFLYLFVSKAIGYRKYRVSVFEPIIHHKYIFRLFQLIKNTLTLGRSKLHFEEC